MLSPHSTLVLPAWKVTMLGPSTRTADTVERSSGGRADRTEMAVLRPSGVAAPWLVTTGTPLGASGAVR